MVVNGIKKSWEYSEDDQKLNEQRKAFKLDK